MKGSPKPRAEVLNQKVRITEEIPLLLTGAIYGVVRMAVGTVVGNIRKVTVRIHRIQSTIHSYTI